MMHMIYISQLFISAWMIFLKQISKKHIFSLDIRIIVREVKMKEFWPKYEISLSFKGFFHKVLRKPSFVLGKFMQRYLKRCDSYFFILFTISHDDLFPSQLLKCFTFLKPSESASLSIPGLVASRTILFAATFPRNALK